MDHSLPSSKICLNLPASHKHLELLGAVIQLLLHRDDACPAHELLVYQVELAVHEVCTNIIEHAYAGGGGRIQIYLSILDNPLRFVVDLLDTGASFDYDIFQPPNLVELQTRGYGLFLINRLSSSVTYHPKPGHNHWRLEKRL